MQNTLDTLELNSGGDSPISSFPKQYLKPEEKRRILRVHFTEPICLSPFALQTQDINKVLTAGAATAGLGTVLTAFFFSMLTVQDFLLYTNFDCFIHHSLEH